MPAILGQLSLQINSLGAIPDTSISGRRVARELSAIIERHGKPSMIVSDHGTEYTCNALLAWCRDNRVDCHFIAPGKPMLFDLDDARAKIAAWVSDFNTARPHSALGYLTPAAYAATFTAMDDRPRNPDQLRRSSVAPVAPPGVQTTEALTAWMTTQWQVRARVLVARPGLFACSMAASERAAALRQQHSQHPAGLHHPQSHPPPPAAAGSVAPAKLC